jgi:peptide/nickel transport system ATP-binding protein
MNFPLLQIKNLDVSFKTDTDKVSVIKNSSFEINKGEILGIVGESGSGKTVTSLSILQLLPSSSVQYNSGEILFSENGKEQVNMLSLSEGSLQKIRGNQISMIFQEPMTSLNPVLTCGRQVMEAILQHEKMPVKNAKEKTIELFNQVKLHDPEQVILRHPHQLSGGQKQRVMIAMAMSCNPLLLIADEPTTALDVTVQKGILELLKELQKKNQMGVIYITHDLGLAAEIADRVMVMYKGEIVEINRVREIFSNPANPYTKALIKCRPSASSKGKRLPVVSDFISGSFDFSVKDTLLKKNPNQMIEPKNVLLKVENLKVYFPAKKSLTGKTQKEIRAVDDVSFSVSKGETLGLVGESGCGKTTLGRVLIRLIDPTSGSIYFNNINIARIGKELFRKMRKDIQIIFQDPYGSLNPRITIGQAINEPMKIHEILPTEKQRKEKIIELLKKVGLKPEHFNRYPHEFSGGQRQRICIARALGLNPEFIICDESVSALDVSVQAQVLNLLNDLKDELGFTCIFISHDLGVVHYISDNIMVMNKGKIVERGTADQIYFEPKNEYTQRLIESIPKVDW